MFKLVPTVRGGAVNSSLVSSKFSSVDDARAGAKQLMHENSRVIRVMIVEDPSTRFVEWLERS
jgi:hypothetical protein